MGLELLALVALAFWVRSVSTRTKRLNEDVLALRSAVDDLRGGDFQPESPTTEPLSAEDEATSVAFDENDSEEAETNKSSSDGTEPEDAADDAEQTTTSPSRKRWNSADIEQMIGAKWSVILGGITVALGALFLVRYSIEAGLLGPAARVFLGTIVSIALLAGGEWLRRHDKAKQLPVFEKADIPGVLTGAGVVAAFGTLYAAHALYGFIGPGIAFVGLTLIGLAALALSAIHGPKLAAIGILGAFGAPILVESNTPNPFALVAHVLVVTTAALGVARIRNWRWLTISGVVGSLLWALLISDLSPYPGIYIAILLIGLAVIFITAQCWQKLPAPSLVEDTPVTYVANGSLFALALVFALHCVADKDFPGLYAGTLIAGIYVASAIVWPSMVFAPVAAAFMVVIAGATSQLDFVQMPDISSVDEFANVIRPPNIQGFVVGLLATGGIVSGIALYGVRRNGTSAPRSAAYLASGIAVIAVLLSIIAYARVAPFETHLAFGAWAVALAALFVGLCELAMRQRPDDLKAGAPAAFAVAAIALIAFALGMLLSSLWWPFGMALTALGISYVFKVRPLRVLPWLAIIAAALSAASIWTSMPLSGVDIGTTPFINQLIVIIGLPAGAVIAGGEILRRNWQQLTSAVLTSLGLFLFALFVALELRHWISGGEITSNRFGLVDMAVQSIAALGFSIGLQRVAKFTGASIYNWASLFVGIISVIVILLGLLIAYNPFLTHEDVGETNIFNALLPAYFITGVLAGLVAYLARPVRPRWYTLSYAFLAALLLFTYFTLETRHFYQGSEIGLFEGTGDLEFWTYSAVWLVLGGILLGFGIAFQSLPLRVASGIMIGLTILKVFLLDMTALTGVLRALSFMGLGLSLIVIGRFYQRILIGRGGKSATEDEPETV